MTLRARWVALRARWVALRARWVTPVSQAKIQWFTVEWDAAQLSWEDFRGKVLGATDPTTAAEGSLRRVILDDWQKLGLDEKPFTGKNGM